jgi:purine-binding chemotaxis protein CheW
MVESELDQNKYIVFQIGNKVLSIPLMSAREVVESGEIKPVSKSKKYFNGVTNIRGEVVGVIDLRKRFDVEGSSDRDVLIVFDFEDYTLGAKVDRLIRVDEVLPEEIHQAHGVKKYIENRYIEGIYQKGEELITIVDIKSFLKNDTIKAA